jgi:nitroimidazol reductase NimA-like FMN-containing flavoprotein (pyridoxamine 5'-phosphate oxidase superfamily)
MADSSQAGLPTRRSGSVRLRSGGATGHESPPQHSRTIVRRFPERGAYSASTIREILSEGLFCHVGFVDGGVPVVIPMVFGVNEGSLVIHGIPASRLLGRLRSRIEVCVTVTLFDGLVLAQSAFDHSMNYRSVVIFGRAHWLRSDAGKLAALRAISEQVLPDRWADVRPPSAAELRQTHVLSVPLAEASAKIRSGPPSVEDLPWDTWTGVLPARLAFDTPVSDGRSQRVVPDYVVRRGLDRHR